MDTARIIKEEDEAWAAMHGLEPEQGEGAINDEFLSIVGNCAVSKSHVNAVYIHQEHSVTRQPTTINWEQFTDVGTKIVRGNN